MEERSVGWVLFGFITNLLIISRGIEASCPFPCTCDLDQLGRRRTRCEDFAVSIPGNVDIATVDYDVQVLIISGSSSRSNNVSLSRDMFRNKPFLEEIVITNGQLFDIGFRTFELVSDTLQVLNLSYNNIQLLHEENFRNLSQVVRLHLDHNQIELFHSALLLYMPSMTVLTISANRLQIPRCSSSTSCGDPTILPRQGIQLPALQFLDLSGNLIGPTIPDLFFRDLTGLRVLNVSKNQLESLPWTAMANDNFNLEELDLSRSSVTLVQNGQLSGLRNLRRLSLAGNPVLVVSSGVFTGFTLDYLDLSRTSPSALGPDVFLNGRIFALNLSDSGLRRLNSDTFQPISQDVAALDVSGNSDLVLGSRMFSFLPYLRVLLMRRMHLTGLPSDIFDYANSLEEIDLSQNTLLALDAGVFAPLKNLLKLNLGNNQLRSIPTSIALPRVQEIDLSDNRLTTFPESVINALSAYGTSLTSLHLNTNPWVCDCKLFTLTQWLKMDQSGPAGYQAVCVGTASFTCPVCYQPADVKGVGMNQIRLAPCERQQFLNPTLQNSFAQSWGTSENSEPWTTLTGVFVNNTIINNAVISNAVLRNATFTVR